MNVRFLPCGDGALTVEIGNTISAEVNARIIALAEEIAAKPVDGIVECVPTYRSLMVVFDPERISRHAVMAILNERLGLRQQDAAGHQAFRVPVRYGGPVGIDLDEVAEAKSMRIDDLIALHASVTYRVYMIGFAPGFAYLGGLPTQLHMPRLAVPRQRIEAGAIGIGGQQASINSLPGPSGWRFLGQTPVRLFNPIRSNPFLLKAGDTVTFRPIDEKEEEDLRQAIESGATTGMEEVSR